MNFLLTGSSYLITGHLATKVTTDPPKCTYDLVSKFQCPLWSHDHISALGSQPAFTAIWFMFFARNLCLLLGSDKKTPIENNGFV